jgi:hypothetical protein
MTEDAATAIPRNATGLIAALILYPRIRTRDEAADEIRTSPSEATIASDAVAEHYGNGRGSHSGIEAANRIRQGEFSEFVGATSVDRLGLGATSGCCLIET